MSDAQGLPPVSFSAFVIGLAQSALVHLGEVEDPITGQKDVDPATARHTIDLLGMLAEKTAGNLDEQEQKLLGSLLDEVRSKFVTVSRAR